MMRCGWFVVAVVAGRTAEAQVVERPIAFDTAARVQVITPPLAARLALSSPVWPVSGAYQEARLYEQQSGPAILAVQRADGSIERWTLGSAELGRLRDAVVAGMVVSGQLTTSDRQDIISQPAGGAFVRGGVFTSAAIWGPALGVITDDGRAAAALELLTIGSTFFVTASLAKNRSITRAQSSLAWDGALKGGLIGIGLAYATLGEEKMSDRWAATGALVGSSVGTGWGFNAGISRTDGEAAAASYFSLFLPALGAGLLRTSGGFQGDEARGEVLGLVGASLLGYPIGFRYARRVPYAVTAGDMGALTTASLVGVLSASAFIAEGGHSDETVAGVLTGGLLAGSLLGDRALVRTFDHTENEGWLTGIGALAGGLIGLAIPIGTGVEDSRAVTAYAAGGAIVGLAMTEAITTPRPGSTRRASRGRSGANLASRFTFSPQNLLLAPSLRGAPVSLLNVSF